MIIMNAEKKVLYIVLGIFCSLLFAACSNDSSSPSSPNGGMSDVVILVDKNDPDAMQAPCGTDGSVCQNIIEGLLSAREIPDGIPTLLVKSGVYDESVPPPLYYENPRLLIATPVYLKAENSSGTSIRNVDVFITVPNVTVENFHFNMAPITVEDGGGASLRNCRFEGTPSNRMSILEAVGDGSSLLVENCEIDGYIDSYRNTSIRVTNSTLSSTYISIMSDGSLTNNEIYGDVQLVGIPTTSNTTVQNNTIHGELQVLGGIAEISGNTIYGDSDPEGGGVRVSSARDVEIRLTNNTIWGDEFALYLYDVPKAFISQNRFNSQEAGISIIQCEEPVNIESDGSNQLLKAGFRIDCDDLPQTPGTDLF